MPETAKPEAVTETQGNADARWKLLLKLKCRLTAEIAFSLKIADLFWLGEGSVVNTMWPRDADIVLKVNSVPIAWGEFDIAEGHRAIRITELIGDGSMPCGVRHFPR
jgi:flagellar motor switch/type III secretory pathway protein FliN